MDTIAFANDVVGRMAKYQRHPTGNEDAHPDGPEVDAPAKGRACEWHPWRSRTGCPECKHELAEGRTA